MKNVLHLSRWQDRARTCACHLRRPKPLFVWCSSMSIPRDRPRGRCSSPENPGLRSEFLSETLRWTWAFAERLSIKSNCSAQLRSIMQLRIKACSCAAFSLMTARLSRAYYTKETSSIANNTVSPAEACTFIWHVLMLYNASNLRFETHIQHSISFIQHDVSVPQNDQDNCLASQSTQCPCWKHLVVQLRQDDID